MQGRGWPWLHPYTIYCHSTTVTHCGVWIWPWQWFALGKDNRSFIVSSNGCIPLKIQCVYKWMVQFQKLTRNLFLTLHGQNDRQQRQLSKFRMRYQQFAFHAYCGAAGSVSKMASQQKKAFCVLRFEVSRSVITVQLEFLSLGVR